MIRKNKHAHCRRGVKYSRLILKLDPMYEIHFPQESLFSCGFFFFFFWKLKKNIWRLISVLDPDPYSQNVKRKFVLIVAIRNRNPSPVSLYGMFLTKPEKYNHLFQARLCSSSVKVIIQTLRYFQTLNKFQYFLERQISYYVRIQNLKPR